MLIDLYSTHPHPLQSHSNLQQQNKKPLERLPVINYSLLKETAFRKKLKDLGIPDWGPRPLLQRRHTEWMNLWNANCDAKLPKSKRELLRDLEIWERTQGGMAPNLGVSTGPNAIMAKSFDASAWSMSHGDDFRRLIEDARKKKDVQIRAKESEPAQQPDNQSARFSAAALPEPRIDLGTPLAPAITATQPLSLITPAPAAELNTDLPKSEIPTSLAPVITAAQPLDPITPATAIELDAELPKSEIPSQTETNTAVVQNGNGGAVLDASFTHFS